MKRLLMTGVRQPGSEAFQFTVYGSSETRFPPAEMQMTLGEFQQWVAHSGPPAKHPAKGARQLPLLRCVTGTSRKPTP